MLMAELCPPRFWLRKEKCRDGTMAFREPRFCCWIVSYDEHGKDYTLDASPAAVAKRLASPDWKEVMGYPIPKRTYGHHEPLEDGHHYLIGDYWSPNQARFVGEERGHESPRCVNHLLAEIPPEPEVVIDDAYMLQFFTKRTTREVRLWLSNNRQRDEAPPFDWPSTLLPEWEGWDDGETAVPSHQQLVDAAEFINRVEREIDILKRTGRPELTPDRYKKYVHGLYHR